MPQGGDERLQAQDCAGDALSCIIAMAEQHGNERAGYGEKPAGRRQGKEQPRMQSKAQAFHEAAAIFCGGFARQIRQRRYAHAGADYAGRQLEYPVGEIQGRDDALACERGSSQGGKEAELQGRTGNDDAGKLRQRPAEAHGSLAVL